MKRIKNFKSFSLNENIKRIGSSWENQDYLKILNENVQAAKSFMINKFSKKKPSEVTKEEEIAILSNKEYLEIKNSIVADQQGLLNAFVRFHFDQDVSLPDLVVLKNKLGTYAPFLGSLPMNIEQYAKILPKSETLKKLESDLMRSEKSGDVDRIEGIKSQIEKVNSQSEIRSGFEMLEDALREIGKERDARWLVDALPTSAASDPRNPLYVAGRVVNLKDEYRKSGPEDKQKIINIATKIEAAEESETIKKRFLSRVSSYDSIKSLIKFGEKFIESMGSNINKILKDAESLKPGVAILYEDGQYVALSIRSEDAQKGLCSIAGTWCINDTRFWSYAGGRVQLNIFNFGVPESDKLHLIGVTISEDGGVYSSSDINNDNIKQNGEKYYDQLKRLGYPQEMIDEIKRVFREEFALKKVTDDFYRDNRNIGQAVNNFIKSSYRYTSDDSFNEIKSIFFKIVIQGILLNAGEREMNAIKDAFRGNENSNPRIAGGLMNRVSIEVFDAIFPSPDSEFMGKVAEATIRNFIRMLDFKNRWDKDPSWRNLYEESPGIYERVMAMIDAKDEIMKKIEPWIDDSQKIK